MRDRRGTTLIELLIALTMLSVGVLGLVGTSVLVTRYLNAGRWGSLATLAATERLESLRAEAHRSGCQSVAGGSAPLPGGGQEVWTAVGDTASVQVAVVLTRAMARPETLSALVRCP